MVDANSPVKSQPRMTREKFVAVLTNAGSPWFALGASLYNLIVGKGHDPAFWLAICGREHSFGTNPNSVLVIDGTQSWTNARTVRDPDVKKRSTIITSKKNGTEYVKYQTVGDSLLDGMYRLDDPTYRYQQEGRHSIGQVLAIWTESESVPYTQYVVDRLNEWSTPMAGDDSRFQWTPDTTEFGYGKGTHGRNGQSVELLILHITAGTDSQSWLLGGNGSSTHYLTDRAGKPRAQHVAEADAAWTPGSRDYALRSINVEVEMLHVTDWTDAIMREVAATIAPMMQRHNIPAVYLGRDAGPGKMGMIGHMDVPNPNAPGSADYCGPFGGSNCHTDPGANFDWGKFVPMVAAALAGGVIIPPDDVLILPGNPNGDIPIVRGFRQYLLELAKARYPQDTNAAILSMVGYPSKPEYLAKDGNVYLPCERTILQFTPGNAPPFDLVMMRREDNPPEPMGG